LFLNVMRHSVWGHPIGLSLLSLMLVLVFRLWAGHDVLAVEILDDTFVSHPFRHEHWNSVVSETVDSQGRVAFNQLRIEPKRLTQYLKQLAQMSPDSHPQDFPNRKSRMAYWINAHNALMLRLILDQYPMSDLKAIPTIKQSLRYRLGGVPISVAQIEERMKQEYYPWPEGLLALSELTVDSPRLLNEAYREEALDVQLRNQFEWVWRQPHLVLIQGGCGPIKLTGALKGYEASWRHYLEEKKHLSSPTLMDWIKPALSPEVVGEWASTCPDQEQQVESKTPQSSDALKPDGGLSGSDGMVYQPRDWRLNKMP
jgi:hypothetical protein